MPKNASIKGFAVNGVILVTSDQLEIQYSDSMLEIKKNHIVLKFTLKYKIHLLNVSVLNIFIK